MSKFGVFLKGGSIGSGDKGTTSGPHGKHTSTHDSAEEAHTKAKRMNKQLSPGEKKYYGIRYHVKSIKEEDLFEEPTTGDTAAPPKIGASGGAKENQKVKLGTKTKVIIDPKLIAKLPGSDGSMNTRREETELNELSKKILAKYIIKSTQDSEHHWDQASDFNKSPGSRRTHKQLMSRREKGLDRAWGKMRKEETLDEAMPKSVLQHKQKIDSMSDEERKTHFAGKSKEKLAGMEWRLGYGKGSGKLTKYHDGTTKEETELDEMTRGKAERILKRFNAGKDYSKKKLTKAMNKTAKSKVNKEKIGGRIKSIAGPLGYAGSGQANYSVESVKESVKEFDLRSSYAGKNNSSKDMKKSHQISKNYKSFKVHYVHDKGVHAEIGSHEFNSFKDEHRKHKIDYLIQESEKLKTQQDGPEPNKRIEDKRKKRMQDLYLASKQAHQNRIHEASDNVFGDLGLDDDLKGGEIKRKKARPAPHDYKSPWKVEPPNRRAEDPKPIKDTAAAAFKGPEEKRQRISKQLAQARKTPRVVTIKKAAKQAGKGFLKGFVKGLFR